MTETAVYPIKLVRFQGKTVPILCQNTNGPCLYLLLVKLMFFRSTPSNMYVCVNIQIHLTRQRTSASTAPNITQPKGLWNWEYWLAHNSEWFLVFAFPTGTNPVSDFLTLSSYFQNNRQTMNTTSQKFCRTFTNWRWALTLTPSSLGKWDTEIWR